MQTWRWTELLQMLEVTIIGSDNRVGSQALGEVRHRLVSVPVAALPRWFAGPAGRLSTHLLPQPSAGVYRTFLVWHPDMIVQT